MRVMAGAWLCFALTAEVATWGQEAPKSLDPRFELVEFAAAPDIMTPTGMTIDAKGRVWVIESHTHFRPEGYDGPKSDRIKVFEDTNGDGKADKHTIFLEEGKATMGIGIHPLNKCIYIAQRSKITRYWDEDGDLKPEKQETAIVLETKGDYPHNGLSGFAFDAAGNLYFGLGENLGEKYRVLSKYCPPNYEGGGEGGSIFCCDEKGGNLRRVATGFWNPFHLCFTREGRLFAVDNDPDSRPPCRLLHIVDQGDYGYRFRNGRKGLHPFTAWNGELPGTLPMVAGTGEAPSGVIEDAIQPGSLLVTSWGDHRIERYALEKKGGSFTAKRTVVAQGGENFRPVGITQDQKGKVYFTDWVLKDYNLHKQGRIWVLRPVGSQRVAARGVPSAALDWGEQQAPRLDSPDPFERHAVQRGLAELLTSSVSDKELKSVTSPVERAEWAVAMRRETAHQADRRIPELLADADWRVRFVGIEWIGEERLTQFEAALRENMQKHSSRREEMEATLVALRMLAGEETKSQDEQGADAIVLKMVLDEELPAYTRARSLRYLRPDHPKLSISLLKGFLESKDEDLKLEAIRTLRDRSEKEAAALVVSAAKNEKLKSELRAEATAGLSATSPESAEVIADLAKSNEAVIAIEARRKLTKAAFAPWSGEEILQSLQEGKTPAGDADRGSRFFFTSEQKCSRCHTYDGRGANIGPDLTRIAENRDAGKIAESILHPSKEIAPQFAVYQLQLTSGVVKTGVYIGATAEGKERFVDAEAQIIELDSAEIESRHSLKNSLMPEDISKRMSKEEFLDLVAFLGKKN